MDNLFFTEYFTYINSFRPDEGIVVIHILPHRKWRCRWVQKTCPRLQSLSWVSNPRNVGSTVHNLITKFSPLRNVLSKSEIIKILYFSEISICNMKNTHLSILTQTGLIFLFRIITSAYMTWDCKHSFMNSILSHWNTLYL